ncbi:MAG: M12 family metallopeptidase [Actinomycetota bacterium]
MAKEGKDGKQPAATAVEDSELRGSAKMGTAIISGNNFVNKSVTYYDVGGIAIFEADIALGTVGEVESASRQAREVAAANPDIAFGVGIPGFRWTNCQVPFIIDPALPNQARVTDAIAHWESKTAIGFVPKTAGHANWIKFTDQGGCWSLVGMRGGEQVISLGPNCSTGNTIHEIGHALGLWHEQSREDRDLFVSIKWENIQSGMAAQFNQHITDGDDLGAYDYGSIMHYPRKAFSKNNQDTIVPTDPNAEIGQREALSPGDIAAIKLMYPNCAGPGLVPKKLRDHIVAKAPLDRAKPFKDVGPVKAAKDVIVRPGEIVINPGRLRPFGLSPHHAAEFDEGAASALHQDVLDLEAAAAQSRAAAAQATADAARLEEASALAAEALIQISGEAGE